ncbi:MAG: type II toxin-antitoxin system VapC family toxin [Vicinamibacteria bacterium]
MRAIDTNVVVRLLARDDARQTAAADQFVARGAWVSLIVLIETVWVLGSVYEMKTQALATAIEMLLDHEHLTVQDADVVAKALVRFKHAPQVGFSDCLVLELARKAGHLPLGTFDRALARIEGAERL